MIATALSEVIFKVPDGMSKDILVVMVALMAFFMYHKLDLPGLRKCSTQLRIERNVDYRAAGS
jgi:hypothetical protein